MGEISKKRGDFGEEIVSQLLDLIGWINPLAQRDIKCENSNHLSVSKKPRNTHGIDYIFHYDCPLISKKQVIASISSKINENYPKNPLSKFTANLKDISQATECLEYSSISAKLKTKEPLYTIDFVGILFWLDSNSEYDDLIDEVYSIDLRKNGIFSKIYVVDNKRALFLDKSIRFIQNRFKDAKVEFLYPSTGYSETPDERVSSGSILPIQYINGSIIPIKITSENSISIILSSIDEIEESSLIRLISLGQKLSENLIQKLFILFPSYNKDHHEELVENVKAQFQDKDFIKKVYISTYIPNVRNTEQSKW